MWGEDKETHVQDIQAGIEPLEDRDYDDRQVKTTKNKTDVFKTKLDRENIKCPEGPWQI